MTQTDPSPKQHALQACVKACQTAEHACRLCMDGCADNEKADLLGICTGLSRECVAACLATARLLSSTPPPEAWSVSVAACAAACAACAAECEKHADDVKYCGACAKACRACEAACRALAGSTS